MAKLYYLAILCACAAAQTVEGTVVNSVTNIGIPGIKVEIAQGKTAITDPQGRFVFEDLHDVAWTIHYSSVDYAYHRGDLFQVSAGKWNSPARHRSF
jgi:hypothetical protein